MTSEETSPPDVSVIVVTLNARATLDRCLTSVRDHEVVVVDHGSTDGTPEVVRSCYPRATLLEQANSGFAGGVNAGLRAAHGRHILLLNPDAWVAPGAIEALVRFAAAQRRVAAVGPRLRRADGSIQNSIRGFPTLWRLATQYFFLSRLGPRSRLLNAFYGGGTQPDRVQDVEFLQGSCLLLNRAALQDVGPFDDSFFMFAEEADWCLRARERGWRIVYLPTAEAVHVGQTTTRSEWSLERAYREQERSHLRFVTKHRSLRTAMIARLLIAGGYLLRTALAPREQRAAYRRTAMWLCRTRTVDILSTGSRER